MKVQKHGRYWAVLDQEGKLICLAVYKKGAQEVIRRLTEGGEKCENQMENCR